MARAAFFHTDPSLCKARDSGFEASDALDEDDVDVVFTGMVSLELMHKQILTAGRLESDATGLQDTVLIFDEVDELIFNKGVNTCYVASEPEVENYEDTLLSRATRA